MATRTQAPYSNPYGGGAVVLDSTPYTQYFLNQKAKEQAKEEALDNYFKTLDTKINPAGMRTQEIPILLQQQNADREFYLQNKDRIKNPAKDNGQAYNEFMSRQQAKLAFVENSKKKADIYKQLVPIFADPNKRALMADEAISALQAHDLPITDPRHKEFDIASLNYNPKPFDVLSYQKKIPVKEVAGETIFENMPDYKTSFLRTPKTKITQKFDKDQIAKIAESQYTQDPAYRKLVNDIGNNPTQYQIHNDIYKKFFGKNLDIQHPEQIAVAHTLSLLPKDYEKMGKPEIDKVAYDTFTNARSSAQADARARIRAANMINGQYNPQYHVEAIYESGDNRVPSILIEGKKIEGKRVNMPDEIADKYSRKIGNLKQTPDYFYMSSDGKDVYPIFETGEKTKYGNPIIDTKFGERIPVSTGLIPELGKTFGGTPFTRRTLFTGKQQGGKPAVKESKEVKSKKDPLGLF